MRATDFKKIYIAVFLVFGFVSCRMPEPENIPYEPETETETPALHDGIFVSEHGTMLFNGDGKSIVLDLDSEFATLSGLPEGKSEGEYCFVSNLPPYGWTDVRYDTAHNLEISVTQNGTDFSEILDLGYPSDDGKTSTIYIGAVTEETIPIVFWGDEKRLGVLFEKEPGKNG